MDGSVRRRRWQCGKRKLHGGLKLVAARGLASEARPLRLTWSRVARASRISSCASPPAAAREQARAAQWA